MKWNGGKTTDLSSIIYRLLFTNSRTVELDTKQQVFLDIIIKKVCSELLDIQVARR